MDITTNIPTFDIRLKMEAAIERLLTLIRQKKTLVAATSSGKDSTCTTFLMLEAVRRAKAEGVDQANHWITSADTTVENPAIHGHLLRFFDELRDFCTLHDLPVTAQIVRPSLASQFVVSTIGRGTLVRTPQNSVKDGASKRPCSDYGDHRCVNKSTRLRPFLINH